MSFYDNAGADQNQETSVRQEIDRAKRHNRRDIIFCIIIIIAALLIREGRDTRAVSVALSKDESSFTLVGMDGEKHVVDFDTVEGLERRTGLKDFDRGVQVQAEESKKYTSGVFQNSAYGDYQLHVANKLDRYLVLRTTDGVIVFNYESDETSDALYEYLLAHIPGN